MRILLTCLALFCLAIPVTAQRTIKDYPVLTMKNIRIANVFYESPEPGQYVVSIEKKSDNLVEVTTTNDVITFSVIPNQTRLHGLDGTTSIDICLGGILIQSKNNIPGFRPDIFFSFELTDGVNTFQCAASSGAGGATLFANEPSLTDVRIDQYFTYSLKFKSLLPVPPLGYNGVWPIMATVTTKDSSSPRTLRETRRKTGRRF